MIGIRNECESDSGGPKVVYNLKFVIVHKIRTHVSFDLGSNEKKKWPSSTCHQATIMQLERRNGRRDLYSFFFFGFLWFFLFFGFFWVKEGWFWGQAFFPFSFLGFPIPTLFWGFCLFKGWVIGKREAMWTNLLVDLPRILAPVWVEDNLTKKWAPQCSQRKANKQEKMGPSRLSST